VSEVTRLQIAPKKLSTGYPQVTHNRADAGADLSTGYPQVIHRLSTGEPSTNKFARQAFFQLFFNYFFPYKSITYRMVSRETYIFLTFLKKTFIINYKPNRRKK